MVGFICIDPQDSDREQLEIEGTEHKVWAYYIRCCLQGNVVLVITVRQGKTNERNNTSHENIKQKREQRVNRGGEGGGKVYEPHLDNPEASVDLTSM